MTTTKGVFFDYELNDATYGSHFDDNDSSYPSGWTEEDAPAQTNTDRYEGFWYLHGNSGNTAWNYTKPITDWVSPSHFTNSDWISFQYGPIFFRNPMIDGDLRYNFRLYPSFNSGTEIDEDIYMEVSFRWNYGTTGLNGHWAPYAAWSFGGPGTYYNEANLPSISHLSQPYWVRFSVHCDNDGKLKMYVGNNPFPDMQTMLLLDYASSPSSPAFIFGDPWLGISMERDNVGISDRIMIGGAGS
jgi:hypothetical protein